MSLHQDRDETDFSAPLVSVSLGLPAIFMFGGLKRSDKPARYRLEHGDIVVWGGPSRLFFHGVAPLADGEHSLIGRQRINLTFRRARWISRLCCGCGCWRAPGTGRRRVAVQYPAGRRRRLIDYQYDGSDSITAVIFD